MQFDTDPLTRRPSLVGTREGLVDDGQAEVAGIQLRTDARRAGLRALRDQARRGEAHLAVIPMASLGLESSPKGERVKTTDSHLTYMDEGAEAYVFTSAVVPGVVYKIFPRNPAGGYGLVDRLSTDETNRITNEVRDASSLEPLINKLLVIDELGVPSEILGMGDDGSVVVKQSDARDRDVAGGNKFFHASGDVMAMSNSALTESGFGITSGDIFLVTDLHKFNHVRGVVLDAVVTKMPDILTKRGPFKRFFEAKLNECR